MQSQGVLPAAVARARRSGARGGLTVAIAVASAWVVAIVGIVALPSGHGSAAPGRGEALGSALAEAEQMAPPAMLPDERASRREQALAGSRPNILLISSDDQSDTEMRWMPKTRRLLGRSGIDFTDAINPHPLCCPARAEILTGEYAQNNGVRTNHGSYGGYKAFIRSNASDNLAAWMHDAGYNTGFIGKTLNRYREDSEVMAGWDSWSPMYRGIYGYYGVWFLDDGEPRRYRNQYVTDVVSDKTRQLITDFAARDKPFFIWASHIGPHTSNDRDGGWAPPIPAARDRGKFSNVQIPSRNKPSFYERDVSDKPERIRRSKVIGGPKSNETMKGLTHFFRERIRSLQAIDRANAAAVRALRRSGELDDTLIVYITDNGYMLGEHRQTTKDLPYEEALQIPMLMRGPGVAAGRKSNADASIVDLAPTFLDLAGALEEVRGSGRTDGESLLPTLTGGDRLSEVSLIQAGTPRKDRIEDFGWDWRGVRTSRWTYTYWWDGFEELYDRKKDPYQLRNLAQDPDHLAVLEQLRWRYVTLRDCSDHQTCERYDFGPVRN